MGLISYFKNLYYESKLNKADKLLAERRGKEAESLYTSILTKHPLAIVKLAEYYLSQSYRSHLKTDIKLFQNVIGLKEKVGRDYDVQSYRSVLKRYARHIKERAEKRFTEGEYKDCVELLSALNSSPMYSKESIELCAESKINLILKDIKASKVTSKALAVNLYSFKTEWNICKENIRVRSTVIEFCKQLESAKRYFAANSLLGIILDNNSDRQCLNNAVQIVKGNDVESDISILKSVVTSYGKRIVLRSGQSADDAVALFYDCWKVSSDCRIAMDILKSANEEILRNALVSHVLTNHSSYLANSVFFDEFTKWLHDSFSDKESVRLLEHVRKLGYNVEKHYVDKIHSLISGLTCDEKLPHLNHAQELFPKSSTILSDKLSCAKWYLGNNENDKAISTSDSILKDCTEASLIKAHALCNKANIEEDADHKASLLIQAESSLSGYKGIEANTVRACIDEAYIKAAENYYLNQNVDCAYDILRRLAKKGVEKAAFAFVSHRLNELRTLTSPAEKQTYSSTVIKEVSQFGIDCISQYADFQSLWGENITATITLSQTLENEDAIKSLQTLLSSIDSAWNMGVVTKGYKNTIVKELISRKYLLAKDLEGANKLDAAADTYKDINSIEDKRTPTLSALRFIICKLKSQNRSEIFDHKEQICSIIRNSATAFKAEKNEIAYRLALTLLLSGEDEKALNVISEFLPSEEHLKTVCEQGKIIKAQAKLEEFNAKLEAVKNKTLSSNDAIYFINHMLEYANTIKPILNISQPELVKYRRKIKNYAIFKLFEEGKFNVALEKMIKEHPNYLDDYIALRNIAIVCLNIAEAHQLSSNNYKEVISIWLTAIYQERLFIKSLDYTSWDDKYSFSLYEAYGHFNENSIGNIPDNVNFFDTDNNNVVPIKDVQRALFVISDNQHYHEFYTFQKDAMDAFIDLNLDKKCRLVAPYLAHKDKNVFENLSEALEHDRQQNYDNWEEVLSVGGLYQMPQPIYSDYNNAKKYFDVCIDAVANMNITQAKQAFSSDKINLIRRFGKLASALISHCNSKVSSLNPKDKGGFQSIYSFYLNVCDALKDNTLSYIFSNHVMQYVVEEVNSNTMNKAAASDIILSIFQLDKNNTRVKENLQILFKMLIREDNSASTQAVSNILTKLKTNDASLYRTLNNEYEDAKINKELNSIVDKVNNKKMTESTALDKIYSLYVAHTNDDRICENLAQLCNICIMKYIVNREYDSYSSSVKGILDNILNNRSTAFKKRSVIFQKSYNEIWNQLPANARMVILT